MEFKYTMPDDKAVEAFEAFAVQYQRPETLQKQVIDEVTGSTSFVEEENPETKPAHMLRKIQEHIADIVNAYNRRTLQEKMDADFEKVRVSPADFKIEVVQ